MNTIHNTLSKLRFSNADALSNRVRLNTTLYPYPLLVESQNQALITSNPLLIENLQNVQTTLEQATKITYLPASDIDIVESVHEQLSMQETLDDLTHQDVQILDDEPSSPSEDVLTNLAHQAPVVRLVNTMLTEAYQRSASDIHLEIGAENISLRYRIDGLLYDQPEPPRALFPAMVSRVKILAGLNIAEKRLPQDGRIRIRLGQRQLDIRVATTPTIYGESITLRLLDKGSGIRQMSKLGMNHVMQENLKQLLAESHGIILVTGPTGCGKTTTLYAAIEQVRSPDRKIITLEDPVEYEVAGITQIQVKPKIGLTFASGLRSVLRHDPDVLLVGEIRDAETAEMAVHASMTGHIVLASLHTNDAPSALARLADLGVEPFLIKSTIRAILAQRLVRLLCPSCKKPTGKADEPYLPTGCPQCASIGYKGRTAIFELLVCNEELLKAVDHVNDIPFLRSVSIVNGMRPLLDDGKEKVTAGLTTYTELERVLGQQHLLLEGGVAAGIQV